MLIRLLLTISIFYSTVVTGQSLPSHFKTVSHITFSVLWFDIYKAELLTQTGQYLGLSKPLVLKLNYFRDISKQDLLAETKKQITKFTNQKQLNPWITRLTELWPSIKKGDQLAFMITAQGIGHFFFNDKFIGSINDPEFSAAFANIWLSDKSSYPKLAKQLRGE